MSTKAGYRFVPLPNGKTRVVSPPLAFDDIRHDRPMPDCLSGSIDVTWTAKTPVCVGHSHKRVRGQALRVDPLSMPDNGRNEKRYVLPGATVRGAVRAVLEIASYSHLGPINADRVYGKRDFSFDVETPSQGTLEVGPAHVRQGWLRWDKQAAGNDPAAGWFFSPAGRISGNSEMFLIPFDHVADQLGQPQGEGFAAHWRTQTLDQKYQQLIQCEGALSLATRHFGPYNSHPSISAWQIAVSNPKQGRTKPGYLVVTGAYRQEARGPGRGGQDTGTPKKNEYLFPEPDTSKEVPVSPELIREFHKLNTTPSNTGGVPTDSWEFWLRSIGNTGWSDADERLAHPYPPSLGNSIPVFFVKTKQAGLDRLSTCPTAQEAGVCFSLSRVIRVPHRDTVGDVAQRTMQAVPQYPYRQPAVTDPGGWDFARALFGVVEGTDQDRLEANSTERRAALKGRVAFGLAISETAETGTHVTTGVLGQPKPSFENFYLTRSDGYNNSDARIAGRKRYPARRETVEIPAPNDNLDTQSEIHFLNPGATFSQTIKFKNLDPVELGALLWSLTFGETEDPGKYLHTLGRAKGYGFGAMQLEINDLKIKNGPSISLPELITAFEDYISNAMGGSRNHSALPPIKALKTYADPDWGEDNADQLAYGSLADYGKWREDDKKLSS